MGMEPTTCHGISMALTLCVRGRGCTKSRGAGEDDCVLRRCEDAWPWSTRTPQGRATAEEMRRDSDEYAAGKDAALPRRLAPTYSSPGILTFFVRASGLGWKASGDTGIPAPPIPAAGCLAQQSPLLLVPHLPPKRKTALFSRVWRTKGERSFARARLSSFVRLDQYVVSGTRSSRKSGGARSRLEVATASVPTLLVNRSDSHEPSSAKKLAKLTAGSS